MDPRSGDVIAKVAAGDKDDVDLAVKAARDAFDHGKWPRMSGFVRSLSFLCSLYCLYIHGYDQTPITHITPSFISFCFLSGIEIQRFKDSRVKTEFGVNFFI